MRRISLVLVSLLILAVILPSVGLANSVPDIVFSNAWFGDLNAKLEVAPGDKNVQLVVELVNSMDKPIRYVEEPYISPRDSRTLEAAARWRAHRLAGKCL